MLVTSLYLALSNNSFTQENLINALRSVGLADEQIGLQAAGMLVIHLQECFNSQGQGFWISEDPHMLPAFPQIQQEYREGSAQRCLGVAA